MKLIITRSIRKNYLCSKKFNTLFVIGSLFLLLLVLPKVYASIYPIETNPIEKKAPQNVVQTTQQAPPVLRYLDVYDPHYLAYPFSFDSITTGIGYLNSFIFDTLVEFDFNTEELIPSLATQWVVSNDSKEWTFSLRQDVVFHDGKKFNSSDVKFNYDRFINPTHPAYVPDPLINLRMPLHSVEILGEYEIVFNFYDPFPAFINVQAPFIGIISPDSFQGPNITTPIGTGPYKYILTSNASNDANYYNLTRNNGYFRGLAPFKSIDYFLFSSLEDLHTAITNQEGNFVTNANPSNWPGELVINESYWQREVSKSLDFIELVWFNHQKPELSDQRVRQAINYAIDKEIYISELPDINSIPLSSNIPYHFPFRDTSVQGFPYNVTKANELLDEAEYPRGADGYRFDLEIVGSAYSRGKSLNLIASFLNTTGIRCNITYTNGTDDWYDKFFSTTYDMFILGYGRVFQDPSAARLFLHTEGELNTGKYSNPEMDRFIMLGQQTPVQQEREYYYKQVQILAQEEAPYLLLREGQLDYLLTSQLTPLISMSRSGRIGLNYTNDGQFAPRFKLQSSTQQEKNLDKSFHYQNVKILEKPIYFPFADTVIKSTNSQPLTVNMSMSHNLRTFLSTHNEVGKFFELEVDDRKKEEWETTPTTTTITTPTTTTTSTPQTEYSIRCYYDIDEIPKHSPTEQLALFQWKENQWKMLETKVVNTSLRYVEVNLKGEYHILKLTKLITRITYQYFPLVFLIVGGTIGFATIAVVINRFTLRAFKERYEL